MQQQEKWELNTDLSDVMLSTTKGNLQPEPPVYDFTMKMSYWHVFTMSPEVPEIEFLFFWLFFFFFFLDV